VSGYHERFRAALSPANAQQVLLLLRVAAALLARLAGRRPRDAAPAGGAGPEEAAAAAGAAGTCAVRVNELLFDLGLDNINLFQLLRWVKETKFSFKVRVLEPGVGVRGQAGAARRVWPGWKHVYGAAPVECSAMRRICERLQVSHMVSWAPRL
jgi:hypothetical protein